MFPWAIIIDFLGRKLSFRVYYFIGCLLLIWLDDCGWYKASTTKTKRDETTIFGKAQIEKVTWILSFSYVFPNFLASSVWLRALSFFAKITHYFMLVFISTFMPRMQVCLPFSSNWSISSFCRFCQFHQFRLSFDFVYILSSSVLALLIDFFEKTQCDIVVADPSFMGIWEIMFSPSKSQGLKLPDTRTHHTNLTPSTQRCSEWQMTPKMLFVLLPIAKSQLVKRWKI